MGAAVSLSPRPPPRSARAPAGPPTPAPAPVVLLKCHFSRWEGRVTGSETADALPGRATRAGGKQTSGRRRPTQKPRGPPRCGQRGSAGAPGGSDDRQTDRRMTRNRPDGEGQGSLFLHGRLGPPEMSSTTARCPHATPPVKAARACLGLTFPARPASPWPCPDAQEAGDTGRVGWRAPARLSPHPIPGVPVPPHWVPLGVAQSSSHFHTPKFAGAIQLSSTLGDRGAVCGTFKAFCRAVCYHR